MSYEELEFQTIAGVLYSLGIPFTLTGDGAVLGFTKDRHDLVNLFTTWTHDTWDYWDVAFDFKVGSFVFYPANSKKKGVKRS